MRERQDQSHARSALFQQATFRPVFNLGADFPVDDGSFNVLVGATDLGTGSDTVLGQIAAETLAVVAVELKLVAELHVVYGRAPLGSVPARVFATAPCSVLAIRGRVIR
mgnify:CR=1 FL=1